MSLFEITVGSERPNNEFSLLSLPWCSQMEGRVPAELKETFGEEALDHTLVLLTCGDYLMGRTAEVQEFYTRLDFKSF